MIGRLLASAALVVALSGTAMAQMAAPPPANPGPSGDMNSGPGKASPGQTMNNQTNMPTDSTSAGQSRATGGPRSLSSQTNRNTGSTMSSDRQTAQGVRPGQNPGVADKLNACEAKPLRERQACFNEATR